jgi:hypothetical protein
MEKEFLGMIESLGKSRKKKNDFDVAEKPSVKLGIRNNTQERICVIIFSIFKKLTVDPVARLPLTFRFEVEEISQYSTFVVASKHEESLRVVDLISK